MPTPQILADIVRLLIQLLPAMALICLVLAGVALNFATPAVFNFNCLSRSEPKQRSFARRMRDSRTRC
jgi:hypothetical protein